MRYTIIESPANPRIRGAAALKEKRKRSGHDAFLIEGAHLIETALRSGIVMEKVFFTEDYASSREGKRILRQIAGAGAQMFRINSRTLSKLSDTDTPQGIIAIALYRPFTLDTISPEGTPLFAVLDGIQDPGNLGTIIRTADAAGADAVILLPGTCDAFAPKSIRSTAGSIFNIPLIYSDHNTLKQWLSERSIAVVVPDVHATMSIYKADLSRPLAFVFGNEAHGASEEIKREANTLVKIPLLGKAESLNVAASAAICMYEAVRQRRNGK